MNLAAITESVPTNTTASTGPVLVPITPDALPIPGDTVFCLDDIGSGGKLVKGRRYVVALVIKEGYDYRALRGTPNIHPSNPGIVVVEYVPQDPRRLRFLGRYLEGTSNTHGMPYSWDAKRFALAEKRPAMYNA